VDEADPYCTAGQDRSDARLVAADLGIPLHFANFSRDYRDQVFGGFLDGYRSGRTPNPDVDCNRHIKFGAFLRFADRLKADFIATGHYARLSHEPPVRLLKAADADKDQTYFLHAVDPAALARTLFPIGGLRKEQVRALARDAGLAVHAKRDSTGICFVGERPFREFLGRYISPAPGPMVTPEGQTVGEHAGLPYYTLGQRHGLKIGGLRQAAAEPWFVAGKDAARNALIVVQGQEHPLLHRMEIEATDMHWLGDEPAGLREPGGVGLHARLRHRQPEVPCQVRRADDGRIRVRFTAPERAATPGQYVVFYSGDECLGGGTITETPTGHVPVDNPGASA
jgi:tRNA-specific 2-thiouridylase